MQKLLAVTNVVSWACFWTFGYLTLSAEWGSDPQVHLSLVLVFASFAVGVFSYLNLATYAEQSGYAPTRQLDPILRNRAQSQHPL